MNELFDYMTEEQKKEIATLCFEAFKKKLHEFDLSGQINEVFDGLVQHLLDESTPELLTEELKSKITQSIIKKLSL